ncbi:hypothetical protein [Pseudoxanthomonas sp. UTMC 1351]|uniref:hypothetical protein n=1 Tax=Pseudoxanthomonas sp. UTMC 1351 TaxID=2695853 RepID=UPI0034CF62EA
MQMHTYWLALGLLVFPCFVEPSVVGVHPVGEYDPAANPAASSTQGVDLPRDSSAEDRPLSSSAAFG